MKITSPIVSGCVFFLCLMTLYEAFPQSAKKTKKTTKETSGYIVPKVYAQRKSPEQFLKDQLGQKIELKERSIADQVIPDDLIVQGSGCFGFDCINNENFGFNTIRLKENNLRIGFDDTSVGTYPANDWEIETNESASGGTNHFAIRDITGAKIPFKIMAGASTNALFLASTGRIGLRTDNPVLDLHINTSNTPAIRLEQNNSGGFSSQTWDMAGNEANFFVRDVTGGSLLPFRIRPGAPTSSIDIAASGNVGIGTASPQKKLHVSKSTNPVIRIEQTGSIARQWDIGVTDSTFFVSHADTLIPFVIKPGAPNSSIDIATSGKVGIGTASPLAKIHVEGTAFIKDTLYALGPIMPGSIISPSDIKLKRNIADMSSMSKIISSLTPKTFYYRTDEYPNLGFSKNLQYGLIAQEVEKVLPSFVNPSTVLGKGETFKTVNYVGLIPILLQGIKEQIAVNEQQQAEINVLKAKLAQYEVLNARLERLEAVLNKAAMLSKDEKEKKADKK
ncbi:tail fiber domain-containing protein [Emticicia sp. C21]|uniref:tail fiber domain-containing protein n=1 Tax=Emticicia sp. C21 TaxID=2302915 RepID=UPI000E343CCD|nr:tail fiber domain-containing protein [Emticicia sp. C21]RFS14280.1 tail fiber domain-containing protein [Emticicia sp. C21]